MIHYPQLIFIGETMCKLLNFSRYDILMPSGGRVGHPISEPIISGQVIEVNEELLEVTSITLRLTGRAYSTTRNMEAVWDVHVKSRGMAF